MFDVRDTEGAALPPGAPSAAAADRRGARTADPLAHNCRIQNIALREAGAPPPAPERALRVTPAVKKAFPGLERAARYLVLVEPEPGPEERYAAVVQELAHVFCGHLGIDSDAWWAERNDLDLERVEVEAARSPTWSAGDAGSTGPRRASAPGMPKTTAGCRPSVSTPCCRPRPTSRP